MDVKKVCSFVVSKAAQAKTNITRLMVAAIVGTSVLLSGASVSAAAEDVTVAIPDINYAGVATSVMTAVTPGLVAAIGLGLSIWGISFIYRKFKAMGK